MMQEGCEFLKDLQGRHIRRISTTVFGIYCLSDWQASSELNFWWPGQFQFPGLKVCKFQKIWGRGVVSRWKGHFFHINFRTSMFADLCTKRLQFWSFNWKHSLLPIWNEIILLSIPDQKNIQLSTFMHQISAGSRFSFCPKQQLVHESKLLYFWRWIRCSKDLAGLSWIESENSS